jgi:hypothetical protein
MYDALDAVFHNADLTALVRSSDDGLKRAAASLDQQAGANPNITFILRQGMSMKTKEHCWKLGG